MGARLEPARRALPLTVTLVGVAAAVTAAAWWAEQPGPGPAGWFAPLAETQVAGRLGPIAGGDVDGDGDADLVLAGDDLAVIFGRGDGTFGDRAIVKDRWGPGPVTLGDVDGDGLTDVIAGDIGERQLAVARQTAPRLFTAPLTTPLWGEPASLSLGDFDGDGLLDVAVAARDADEVITLSGRPGGGLSTPVGYPVGSLPSSVAAGDVNGDGHPDLVVAAADTGELAVLLGRGAGRFGRARAYQAGSGSRSVALADLDGDGDQDVAVAGPASGGVAVFRNRGDGHLARPVALADEGGVAARPPDHPDSLSAVVTGDFNGDRVADLVVANAAINQVAVLTGRRDGDLTRRAYPVPVGRQPVALAVADFDGDGRSDLAVATSAGAISILLQQGRALLAVAAPR